MHRKRCRNQSRSSSSSRAISVIVTRSCGHIFLPRRACAVPAWPRLHADHAACATVPPHARPCCYSRRMRALVLMDHNFLLPPPTLVLPTAIYYIVCRLLYKIYFRFQDIGLGYICYVHPSSSQETTKHFLAIVGGLHIISFSH